MARRPCELVVGLGDREAGRREVCIVIPPCFPIQRKCLLRIGVRVTDEPCQFSQPLVITTKSMLTFKRLIHDSR